jgi:vacuolar protein 8
MAEIEGLVRALREGDDAAQTAAAGALCSLACNNATNKVLIAEAGCIAPLVELLRDGSAEAKRRATWALGVLARNNAANKVAIAAAGGIAILVEFRGGEGSAGAKQDAAWALENLAFNNDANAVAIAAAIGFDALVQLARGGDVNVDNWLIVPAAGVPAKRKAALVVAQLLEAAAPRTRVPREIKDIIASYL